MKGLVICNTHVKYESPIYCHSKVMTVKFLKSTCRSKIKVRNPKILVLSERSCPKNRTTLVVKKPMLIFLKSRSKFKVRSKILVPMERSRHKKIKALLSYSQGLFQTEWHTGQKQYARFTEDDAFSSWAPDPSSDVFRVCVCPTLVLYSIWDLRDWSLFVTFAFTEYFQFP